MKIAAKDATTPMDLLYVKILRFAMRTIASWPGRELGENVWKISDYYIHFLHIQALTALIPELRFVVQNAKNMPILLLGHSCITVLLSFTSTAHLQVNRLSEFCTIYLVSMLAASGVLFNVGPLYVNYSEGLYSQGIPENSTKVYALATYFTGFPFECDYLRDFRCYLYVSMFTWYMSYFIGTFLSILDLYVYIIVFHIWGHYKILINDLKTIPEPMSLHKYTAEESESIYERLKDCIEYHHLISEFTKKMSDVFGATLLVYTWFMLLSSCLLLLECSYMTAEASIQYGPMTLMVFQELIQFGLVFELIGTAGDDLRKQVYDLPWEYMDMKNRKIVLFLLMNVQKPVRVKALGVTDMGLATVASVIKTSLSYFTFLRTIDN